MSPDPVIRSILIRYEKNLPVSIEEKAVLHTWLIKALKTEETPLLKAGGNSRTLNGFIRRFTSGFFRIFALCLPVKK